MTQLNERIFLKQNRVFRDLRSSTAMVIQLCKTSWSVEQCHNTLYPLSAWKFQHFTLFSHLVQHRHSLYLHIVAYMGLQTVSVVNVAAPDQRPPCVEVSFASGRLARLTVRNSLPNAPCILEAVYYLRQRASLSIVRAVSFRCAVGGGSKGMEA